MIIFYLILLAAFIPFIGFLLAKESTHKTIVFSFSFIVLGISLFGFVSKFSFLGSAQEQILANQLEDAIYDDARLQEIFFNNLQEFLDENSQIRWLEEGILYAINNNSLQTAEQLVEFGEPIFNKLELQIRFYALYSILRDKKFPDYANASIFTSFLVPNNCDFDSINLILSIQDGPAVPIAKLISNDPSKLSFYISNTDAMIPGFDIASALMNKEQIIVNSMLKCKANNSFISRLLPIKNPQNKALFTLNISEKDWFVNPQ